MDWDNIRSHFITSLNSASYAFRSGVGKPCDFMKSGSGTKLKVAVISDTHLRNDFKSTAAFQTGIKRMSCAEPAYDALVIDGDCTNRSYADFVLRQITAEVMDTEDFDEKKFCASVDYIEITPGAFIYHFKNGRTAAWQKA